MYVILVFCVSFVALLFYTALRQAFEATLRLRLELISKNITYGGKTAALFLKERNKVSLSIKTARYFFLVSWTLSIFVIWERLYPDIHSGIGVLFIFAITASVLLFLLTDSFAAGITRLYTYSMLRLLAPFFLFSYRLFLPITNSLFYIREFIRHRSGEKPLQGDKKESLSDDFEELVNSLNENNSDIEEDPEVQILRNALEFQDVKAGSCMIPRSEIVAMEVNAPVDDLIKKFTATRLTRILIYRESIENIIGYVHSFDLFRKPLSIISVIRPVVVVPEAVPVQDLLTLFIKQRHNIALVVDEYGGTSGILTIEDVIEELFGEIDDEHDSESLTEKKINEKEYFFSARLEIEYINEKHGLRLPVSSDYTSLGGLIVHLAGGIPRAKQRFFFDHFRLEVGDVANNRVETVKLILK